ncbi:MAG: hypothetical protein E7284_05585 [Lachnospiraceae bacterium]|nr:hypothetical protein [Lachnospiraceae bacterium]
MEKRMRYITIIIMTVFLSVFALLCWFKTSDEYSMMERRYLKQFPNLTWESVMSGRFMSEFESYSQDQFPGRDFLRGVKSATALFVFGQKANNDLYLAEGYIGKLEYPYDKQSIEHATKVFQSVYDKYLEGTNCKVYYSIIPDKGYFLAESNGYPSIDYEILEQDFCAGMNGMVYIDIFDVMALDDFYKTDTHWRQEKIVDVAEVLAGAMGKHLTAEYELNALEESFYGVYYGQLGLPVQGETLFYLNNDTLENCYVYDYTDMQEIPVYDMDKAVGADPYELYLSGPLSLITIENSNADTKDELIIFRDSFGSSIAPLFVEDYAKITLVDIRYLHSGYLGKYIDFKDQDVLFLYSTLVLNNSETIK